MPGTSSADRGPSQGEPFVSVIMPFLDPPAEFFTEAVARVLAQTFGDWELLLVDDGSGEATRATARRLQHRNPSRIRVFGHARGVNRGIAASRNAGLARARGELVAFLDSDDVWLPHKLEEQVRILDGMPDVQMIFGRSLYWHSWTPSAHRRDSTPPLRVPDRTRFERGEFIHRILRARAMVPCPSSILVRAEAADAVGGFAESVSNLYEDQAFYARMSLGGIVVACNEVWDRYRVHSGSVIGAATPAQALAARRGFLDWLAQSVERSDHSTAALRRTIWLERRAAALPHGPRLLRTIRKVAALPERMFLSVRGSATVPVQKRGAP
jgi:glycosyltransferase involved in cell wall biosynthesis